jgi:hypothetical protein
MKTLLMAFLCFVAASLSAQEPRPKTPTDTTLAAPTSQIAAWYRYAVSLETKLAATAALQKDRDDAVAVAEALLGLKALRERLAALEAQSVPADEYAKLYERLNAVLMHNMYLAGQLAKATAANPQ